MRKIFITSITLTLLIFMVSLSASAEDFTGQVVGVIDGDTIEVMHLGKAERVRLHGVDCPEMGQPFGKRARQYTSTHTLRKTVTIIVENTDKSGQTVGQVILPDMSNLNIVLISAGLAWWHETYAPEDKILMDVQKSAKIAKRGLWADPDPVPPWEWKNVAEKP
ncbi:thermonuclease family protein [bacterium]|nr:thermonuclease family protein [bacterium]